MGYDFDEIRNRIGIDRLDEAERKRLFQEFVKAGGKVIEEKRKRSALTFDREKQRQVLKTIEKKRRGISETKDRELKRFEEKLSKEEKKTPLPAEAEPGFWDKVKVYFYALKHRTISLSGKQISKNFLKFMIRRAWPVMRQFSSILSQISSLPKNNLKILYKRLYDTQKYYIDLFEKMAKLYDEEEFKTFNYFYERKNLGYSVKPKHIEYQVKSLFRKIFIISFFMGGCYKTLNIAIKTWGELTGASSDVVNRRWEILKLGINTIFFQIFPKLHSIMLLYIRRKISLRSKWFFEYLKIEDKERVGYKSYKELFEEVKIEPVKILKKEEEKPVEKKFYELTEEEIKKLDLEDEVKRGLTIMKKVDFNTLIENISDKIPNIQSAPPEDKTLITFLLLREFEQEYSFLLTSPSIRYLAEYTKEGRIDYKEEFNLIYSRFTLFLKEFYEYFNITARIKEVKSDKLINEIEKYNRLTGLEARRSAVGHDLRKKTKTTLQEISNKLKRIIEQKENLLENPEEELHFDTTIESKKKVEGKKVIEALQEAVDFISAMIYRLSPEGDLYGASPEIGDLTLYYLPEEEQITEEKAEEIAEKKIEEQKQEDFLDELMKIAEKRERKQSNEKI